MKSDIRRCITPLFNLVHQVSNSLVDLPPKHPPRTWVNETSTDHVFLDVSSFYSIFFGGELNFPTKMGKDGKGDEDGWKKQWELYTRTLAPRYKHASKGSSKMVVWLSMPSSTNRPWPPKGDGCRVSWGAKWPPLAWVKNGMVCDGKGSCQDVFCWRNHTLLVGDIYFCVGFALFFLFFFFWGGVGEEGMCSMRSEMAHFWMWRLEPLQQLQVHMLLPGTMAAMVAWVNANNIVKGGKPSPSSSVDFSGWELFYARSVYNTTNAIQHIHAYIYIYTYLSSYIHTKIVSALASFETFATMWSKWRNINIEPCT